MKYGAALVRVNWSFVGFCTCVDAPIIFFLENVGSWLFVNRILYFEVTVLLSLCTVTQKVTSQIPLYKSSIKSNGNSSIFLTLIYSQEYNIYVQSTPWFITFRQMSGRRRTTSARPSLFMFHIHRPIALVSSSLVLYQVLRSCYFSLAKGS